MNNNNNNNNNKNNDAPMKKMTIREKCVLHLYLIQILDAKNNNL